MTSEAITVSIVDLSGLTWRKSSRSGQGNNGNCVEVAFTGQAVAVRDSKKPGIGTLVFPVAAWVTLSSGHHRA